MREAPTPAGAAKARTPTVPTLGVVMPAYNEGHWVLRAVEALLVAAETADWTPEIVVVDDGSTDPASLRAFDDVARLPGVRVLHQPNAGRFAARSKGLDETDAGYVLLLDARVEVAPESLLRIRRALESGLDVWNYDVMPASTRLSPLFWTGITKVWWRDYFRSRRPVSFGIADFDRYPKGTGAFFGPTQLLRDASSGFDSHFSDRALASDDTRLLRTVASVADINLSPEVLCRHHVKGGRGSFVRQCYYRGTTFVDGYLSDAGRAEGLLAGAGLAGLAGLGLACFAPRSTGAVAAVGCVAAGSLTRWSGGSVRESAAVALLSPVFGVVFGAGAVRGLRLAARAHAQERPGPA